jgi:16S rRNA processing protein RimM
MKALPLSDLLFKLPPDTEITLHLSSGLSERRKLSSARKTGKKAVLSLNGISSPEPAYRGALIEADTGLFPDLSEEEYLYDQIIGLTVLTPDGTVLGKISGIFETGSNDVYVVQGVEREYLIPAIRDVIREIDLKEEKITIYPIEGLLD